MKHFKLFANDAEYQAFVGGGDYVTPNICLNSETMDIHVHPIPPLFPMYLKSNEGEGEYRHSDGNETSIKLYDYISNNMTLDNGIYTYYFKSGQLYIDEIEINFVTMHPSSESYYIYPHEYGWGGLLNENGSFTLAYED